MNSRNRKALEVRAMEEQRKSSSSGLQDGIAAQLDRAAHCDAVSPELEAMARAMFDSEHNGSIAWEKWTHLHRHYVAFARAGLAAIREPSDRVNTAGFFATPFNEVLEGVPYQRADTARVAWEAMIGAILGEPADGRPTQRSTTGDDAGPGIDK